MVGFPRTRSKHAVDDLYERLSDDERVEIPQVLRRGSREQPFECAHDLQRTKPSISGLHVVSRDTIERACSPAQPLRIGSLVR
jgi:hypothetical protein